MQATKRITAVFLAFILTLGLFAANPVTASAAGDTADQMETGTWTTNPRYITFGSYNGHDLVWRVLEVTESGGNKTAFLLLDDLLRNNTDGNVETRAFQSTFPYYNTFPDSEIEGWLNGSFLSAALTGYTGGILDTDYGPGPSNSNYKWWIDGVTQHATQSGRSKVFLLSCQEAGNPDYFSGDADRAVANMSWWLRSPGVGTDGAAFVNNVGSVYGGGYPVNLDYSVRPALKIDLSSGIFTSVPVNYGVTINVTDGLNPVSGAKITINPSSARSERIFTDSTGLARFADVPGGSYTLTVSKPGYADAWRDITVSSTGNSLDVTLTADPAGLPYTVYFGQYSSAPLLWRVLDIDTASGSALLLTDKILPGAAIHFDSTNTAWNGSNLQTVLNGTSAGQFLHTDNFTAGENAAILDTSLSDAGTTDKAFALSRPEAEYYMPDATARSGANGYWWLRTEYSATAMYRVSDSGGFYYSNLNVTNPAHPAVWVGFEQADL